MPAITSIERQGRILRVLRRGGHTSSFGQLLQARIIRLFIDVYVYTNCKFLHRCIYEYSTVVARLNSSLAKWLKFGVRARARVRVRARECNSSFFFFTSGLRCDVCLGVCSPRKILKFRPYESASEPSETTINTQNLWQLDNISGDSSYGRFSEPLPFRNQPLYMRHCHRTVSWRLQI